MATSIIESDIPIYDPGYSERLESTLSEIKGLIERVERTNPAQKSHILTTIMGNRIAANLIIFVIFSVLYYIFFTKEDWLTTDKQPGDDKYTEALFFSGMVHGTLGFANRYPKTNLAKFLVTAHVFTVIIVNIMLQ